MAMELDYNRTIYGNEYQAGPFELTAEMVQAYTNSIGDTNPISCDGAAAKTAGFRGIVAPPTICTMFVRQVKLPSIDLKFGNMRFHAGQRVQSKAPIIAGDSLSASSHLKDVYAKTGRSGTMVFTVWETTFSNQDGEVVADVQESFAARE